jgi:F-type H+-transporting ATPase subunit epsilon
VIILAEIAERAAEIDVERCRSALQRAQAELAKAGSGEVDWQRAATALERAMARLQVASKS